MLSLLLNKTYFLLHFLGLCTYEHNFKVVNWIITPFSTNVAEYINILRHCTQTFYFSISADSFVGRGPMVKGMRKHRGPRFGIISYRYCNYFVRVREGHPPKHYYPPPQTGNEKLEEYIHEQRSRRIISSL